VLAALIVGCSLFGLAIGSFLNVVIYRVPRHESIVSPGSACPACSTPIKGRDNIPLISWIVLRARCRTCGAPISARYPLVELVSAFVFGGAAARVGYSWDLPVILVLLTSLLALAFIDLDFLILPKRVVYPSLALLVLSVVVAAAAPGQWHRMLVATTCALVWFAVFFLINALRPKALGFGDVRLALILGLGLGWLGVPYVVMGFFAGNLIGAVIGLALIATKRMSKDQPVPYGVFLALGAAAAIYIGPEILLTFPRLR
jgi:leader peptidase (prepilin peptidase)/N-methyltransferase